MKRLHRHIDVRDATFVAGLASIGAGLGLVSISLALVVVGAILLALWVLSGLPPRPPKAAPR